ncbi:cation channel sperm-associated auxiliary subunit gamma [Sorex araneus]|uniref:cation channel sperm-associated auxiliary subunit gamma n=1 Tax=Sorex araneus TaxID=42254 RepID=UPI002433637D|nr:cation channel sperm-associated auxiliary subunit gamma [Sorex araneus]
MEAGPGAEWASGSRAAAGYGVGPSSAAKAGVAPGAGAELGIRVGADAAVGVSPGANVGTRSGARAGLCPEVRTELGLGTRSAGSVCEGGSPAQSCGPVLIPALSRLESPVCCPAAMTPAGPARPTLQIPRVLCALLAVLSVPWRLRGMESPDKCSWEVVLSSFENIGKKNSYDHFSDQEPLNEVDEEFRRLVDLPNDDQEKYLGFPYYLKVNYSCEGLSSEAQLRSGHLMGLKPLVLVIFQSPINFYHWKIEHLEIQMEAIPIKTEEYCHAELVCSMNWYVPMPIKNGSVIMNVDISSNGLGPIIPTQRFQVNINGFLKRKENTWEFTLGNELFSMTPQQFSGVPSRPLWYTVDHTPVLILGDIPEEKSVLLTDTNFKDFFLVELSIDSCWVSSQYCPKMKFTATIHDTISTESTVFVRQNQLVYYFTGRYIVLHEQDHSTNTWVRVLHNECIKRLCPVFFPSNGSEYIIALPSGKTEGYVHLGTIRDGHVTFELIPRQRSVCEMMQVLGCSITWATYISTDYYMLLLVEIPKPNSRNSFQVVHYNLVDHVLTIIFTIPEFIPDAPHQDFLMIFGNLSYTTVPMIPKGMFYNPYNNLLFIWGNFLMQSFNSENFIYLTDFPKELSIKYVVDSYHGEMALVTENEEIWFHMEESYRIYRLFPSRGWEVFVSLQKMQDSTYYAQKETMLTLFYENRKLYQLMYLEGHPENRLVKRLVPVEQLLSYQQSSNHYALQKSGSRLVLTLTNRCTFMELSLRNLPAPQMYSRQEHYRALPPISPDLSGFHLQDSLTVYQGLVYYLLWLHSKYNKPYADPVHDPTWRWWKNRQQDQDYYFYLSSNRKNMEKVYLDPWTYEKIYNLEAEHSLPRRIFLDRGNKYTFSIYVTLHSYFNFQDELCYPRYKNDLRNLALTVRLPDYGCTDVQVTKTVLYRHKAVHFWITLSDLGACSDQGIIGHHLLMSSLMLKVLSYNQDCLQSERLTPHVEKALVMPVFLGCPPGKRLAFDITYTLQYNKEKNRHYFDCVNEDPEMPCFLFRDTFYPFFLIQDLVTGDSGKFKGSYILKVVGGGPTPDTIREYSEEEIIRYNSPLNNSRSLIWIAEKSVEPLLFTIMSYENPGIEWLCLENSPCYDISPQGFFSPDFFFKVLVSNRGVDNSTYCDYQLTFLLHIHGFPISARRTLFIFMESVSAIVFISLVILYIISYLMVPLLIKGCNMIRWKMNTLMVSDSYYTNPSSSRILTVSSKSVFPIPASSRPTPHVTEESEI